MAARNERDVGLVIRARDEASKTVEAVVDAFHKLLSEQSAIGAGAVQTQSRLGAFTQTLLALDKAAVDVAGKLDTATSAFDRQQSRIAANAERFDALTREAQSLTRVVALLSVEADKAFIGPRRNGLSDSLRAAKNDLAGLHSQINSLGGSITKDLEGTTGARNALQQLASTEIAAAQAADHARVQIELETRALHDNEAAARRAAAAQEFFNAKFAPGLTRNAGGASAAGSAEVLAETAAHDALIQKLKQEEATKAALARETQQAAEAQSRFNAAYAPGLSRGPARSEADVRAAFSADDADTVRKLEERQKALAAAQRLAAASAKEEDAAIQRLRADLDPLATLTARQSAEMAKLNDWFKRGKITAAEFAASEKLVGEAAKKAALDLKARSSNDPKVSLFGLRPYETQNLLFQFNDIATQLSSGTSLSQTLAQQGGQIFQLFQNRIGPAIVGAFTSPAFLGAGAVITAFALGVNEAANQMERLRQFTSGLAASADGAFYDPKALEASAKALDRYAISAEDAVATVQSFARQNISQDKIVAFGTAAKDLADVMGGDLKDAVKQVGDAFTKGFEAVDKLDQSLNFLTASEREHIQSLFEEGRAGEARAEAFRIFSEKQEEAARNSRGPWADAAKALETAWDGLIRTIANTSPIVGTVNAITDLASGLTIVLNRLQGISTLQDIMAQKEALATSITGRVLKATNPDAYNAKMRELTDQETALWEKQRAAAAAAATGDTVNVNSQVQQKADDAIHDAAQKRLADAKLLTREKRIQLAIDEASTAASQAGASAVGIAEAKRTAADAEREKIRKEDRAAATAAAAERERAINQFSGRVIGAEGGSGKNPFSSAEGFGQFIDGTWLEQFRKVFSAEAAKLTQDQILSLRQNQTTAKAIVDNYARENAAFLEKFGAKVTAGNLYLAHFLGAKGAKAILTANGATPVDQILGPMKNGAKVLSGNQGYLRTERGKGRYRTADELEGFIAQRVGDTGAAQSAGTVEIAKLLEENKQRQDDFNASVDKGNQARQTTIAGLQAERGLMDEALIAAQRQAAIDKAEADLRQKVIDANNNLKPGETAVELTQTQIDKTRELVAAEFDLAHERDLASARLRTAERDVQVLMERRAALQAQLGMQQMSGDSAGAAGTEEEFTAVSDQLDIATQKLHDFYQAMIDGGPAAAAAFGLTVEQVRNMQISLDNSKAAAGGLGTQFLMTGQQINESIANGAANALDQFAQKVAAGENVMKSLKNAFLSFAADFLRKIAMMIIQQAIFNAIGGSSGGGGGGGDIAGMVGSLFGAKHSGGMPGGSGMQRGGIDPAVFSNALRLHTGGIPGLRANEVPTILERDEEVLKRSDARHVLNGGGKSAPAAPPPNVDVKIINAIDAGDALSKGLDTRVGQKAVLNFITANPNAVKAALG